MCTCVCVYVRVRVSAVHFEIGRNRKKISNFLCVRVCVSVFEISHQHWDMSNRKIRGKRWTRSTKNAIVHFKIVAFTSD